MLTSIALTSRIRGGISLTSGGLERVGPDTRDAVAAAAGDGSAPSNDLVARWRRHRPQTETPYSNKAMICYWLASWGARLRIQNRDLKGRKAAPVSRGLLRLQLEPRDPGSVKMSRDQ